MRTNDGLNLHADRKFLSFGSAAARFICGEHPMWEDRGLLSMPLPEDESVSYPRPLETFFEEGRCPDCGSQKFHQWQDGGHDVAIQCDDCESKFGIQEPPFNMIERI